MNTTENRTAQPGAPDVCERTAASPRPVPAPGRGSQDRAPVPGPPVAPLRETGHRERAAGGPTIGVLALQGAVREHLAILDALGVAALEVRSPGELARVDGLILPGGESTTMSKLIESSGLLDPLHERLDGGMPALGTCAGMILLATEVADGRADQHVLGAIDIGVRRNAFGRQVDSFETDLTVRGFDTPLHAVFIRAPVVERVGPGVEVLATVEGPGGVARPVACRQGGVVVAAFHPELVPDARLHQLLVAATARVRPDPGLAPRATGPGGRGAPTGGAGLTGTRKEG